MEKKYKHIFFDLDHTLWDHDANSREALYQLYDEYGLYDKGVFSKEQLFSKFKSVNDLMWDQFNRGVIKKSHIRNERFEIIFEQLNLPIIYRPKDFSSKYIGLCPHNTSLIPGAIELLEDLTSKGYALHIITNGFTKIQGIKLEKSGLSKYFNEVVTSERAKSKKPSNRIFDFAMKVTKSSSSMSIMIGDNLKTDMAGAKDVMMDQVYFNPEREPHTGDVTYEVHNLGEISNILN